LPASRVRASRRRPVPTGAAGIPEIRATPAADSPLTPAPEAVTLSGTVSEEKRAQWTARAAFAAALALAYVATLCNTDNVRQALIWLPTGVAIGGLRLLGWRQVWIVLLAGLGFRSLMDFGWPTVVFGSLSATAEALAGAALLGLLHVQRGIPRLRDVMSIYLVAMAAPIASILVALGGRLVYWPHELSLLTGFGGWWRMNAIGVLAAVPLALAWPARRSHRGCMEGLARITVWALISIGFVLGVLLFARPGVTSIVLLGALPMVSFAAALQLGNRGATATAFVGAMAIAMPAGFGIGPFQGVDIAERHVVAQMVLVAITALAPLFGALLAERDANAARLLQSEGVGSALLRILPDASYRLDARGTVLDAVLPSDPALPPAEEVIGKHIREITPPELADRLLSHLERTQRGESTEPLEYRLATAQGRRDREVRFVQLPNGETMSVARDITDRKRAERQLTMQAAILEQIATGHRRADVLDAICEGIEALIPDGRCTIMMLHGDRLHLAASRSLPEGYVRAIDGMQVGDGNGACGTAAFTGQNVICSDTVRDPRTRDYVDLIERYSLYSCWSIPVRSIDGSVLGTIAMYHEQVREPQPFEVRLVERAGVMAGLAVDRDRREALLASMHENLTEGLFRTVPGEGFVYVNAAFARMFGYESTDQLLRHWSDDVLTDGQRGLAQLAGESVSVRGRKVQMHRRDGSSFWALISTTVTFDDDDAELVCDGTITDISNAAALEDQLRQAQKMEAVGQLAAGVAHDFNNILTAIAGFGEAVLLGLPEHSPHRADIDQILAAARRATNLTRQLLAFGRQQVLKPEILDLGQVVGGVAEMLRRLIGKHIQLTLASDGQPVRATADRGQLEQVLLNLVINARDAMPQGGRISVRTEALDAYDEAPHAELTLGRYAVLRVRDEGQGMSQDVQARAFDPFFTTKGAGRGTGLGLSTVYGIVKQSGGAIAIDSKPGEGTEIVVLLPFADELPEDERTVLVPRREQRSTTVLVVEDEPFVLELANRTLGNAGYEVLRARDGHEALAAMREHGDRVELVVTDIVMPHLGGQELAQLLWEERPNLRVLFMSGYAREILDLPADDVGRSGFLHKPFTTQELCEEVTAMLPGARSAATDESTTRSER
jgi:PAS domain S-box-containing protein